MIFYLDTPHPFLQWYYYISRLFVFKRMSTHSHLYFFKHTYIEIIGYFFVICSGSFTNWLDCITCPFVLYGIPTHSGRFTRKINISAVIDNRNIWSMKSSKWVHWCVYILSFRGLYSYKHIILVTDTLVTDDSYLTLSGFYSSLFHWEKRVFTSS